MKEYKQSAESGFTLVELMMVIAIIGILSSMANAAYDGYQAKAKRSEAKIALASLYTGQMAFWAENGSFTLCLGAAGTDVTLQGGSPRNYGVGFNVAFVNFECGADGITSCNGYQYTSNAIINNNLSCLGLPNYINPHPLVGIEWFLHATQKSHDPPPALDPVDQPYGSFQFVTQALLGDLKPTQSSFQAAAAGLIGQSFGVWDVFTMDQRKRLLLQRNGL